MATDNTFVRSLHDLGLAGWFGSVLMAAAATNRAAGDVDQPTDVARVTNGVWKRWRPINAALIATHLVGATGLLYANKSRLGVQRGVVASSVAKTALTAAALGASAFAGVQGKLISDAGDVPMNDATTPGDGTPDKVAAALRKQNVLQWAIPVLTGSIVVLGALQGEQQRPSRVLAGTLDRLNPVS